MAQSNSSGSQTLERGELYFFYRPKVDEEHPKGRGDIQRMYMVMHPDGKQRYRLAVIGKKKLPDPSHSGGERYWGFVETVRKSSEPIRDDLSREEYGTKTRGTRHVPGARPAGEGVYRIVRHDGHTHLAYALELPKKPKGVQDELNIERQGSYVISVANPDRRGSRPAAFRSRKEVSYPKRLEERFRGRKFSEVDPPDFLNKKGSEFLLISAAHDVKKDLGIQLNAEHESESDAALFKDLKMDKSKRSKAPLFKGQWK